MVTFWSLLGRFLVAFKSLFGHFLVPIWSLFGRYLGAFRSLAATFLLNFNHHDCTWLLSISAPIAIKNDGLSNGFTCPDKVILNDSRKASAAKIFYSLCFDPEKLRIFLAVLHKKEKASYSLQEGISVFLHRAIRLIYAKLS